MWLKSLSVYLVYSPPFSRNRKPRPEDFQAGLRPLPAFDNLYSGRSPGAALAFFCPFASPDASPVGSMGSFGVFINCSKILWRSETLVPGIAAVGFCGYRQTALKVPHPRAVSGVGSLVIDF